MRRALNLFRRLTMVAAASATWLWSSPAWAHSVDKRFGDFYGGMLHPVTAIEHVLPIVGVGLLAGQQGAARARWVLWAFPLGLLLGSCAATFLITNEIAEVVGPYVELANRCSFIVLGILVAAAIRLPVPVLATGAVVLGATHGFENSVDVTNTVAVHLFLPGVLVTGFSLIAVAAAVAVSLKLAWQQIVVRVAGSWLAAIGLLIVGLS